MVSDDQWKEQLENQVPYTPKVDNYFTIKNRKKLPMPKTRYKIDLLFKKK